jgi:putative PIN family toxin of toxin-antitoxin system
VKVVIDTNVLMSGIFFSGPPYEILQAWRKGDVQFVSSKGIIDEYIRVSRILADKYYGVEISSILTLIIALSETIEASALPHQVCDDQDDDKFLACALSSETKIIISGDKHLLKLSGYRGILILTPRAFVEQFLKKQA